MAEIAEAEKPTSHIIEQSIDQEIDSLDGKRERKGKQKPEEKQVLDLGKGEDIETPEQKAAKVAADAKLKTDTELAKKHGGEKIDDKGNITDAAGKVVKTAEEITAESKPKKKKFWKKEEPAAIPPTNGEAKSAETTPATDTKTDFSLDKLPKEIQDKLKRVEFLEGILSRPSVKLVLKAEESGKDFKTFYSEVSSKDPFKISNEEVYKMQLEDVGGYTQAEKERKIQKFNEKDEDDQADIIAPFRKSLKDRYDKEQNEWTPTYQEPQPDPKETVWQELNSEIPKIITPFAKEIESEFLIEMTPELIKTTTDTTRPLVVIDKETGRIDTKDFLRKKFIIENINLIAETIANNVTLEVEEEFKTRYNLPLSAETGNHIPQPRQLKTDLEKNIKALEESLPK